MTNYLVCLEHALSYRLQSDKVGHNPLKLDSYLIVNIYSDLDMKGMLVQLRSGPNELSKNKDKEGVLERRLIKTLTSTKPSGDYRSLAFMDERVCFIVNVCMEGGGGGNPPTTGGGDPPSRLRNNVKDKREITGD
ncbi:hypothetical protein LXL04_038251 [Taraxacum kok-saghyz]